MKDSTIACANMSSFLFSLSKVQYKLEKNQLYYNFFELI